MTKLEKLHLARFCGYIDTTFDFTLDGQVKQLAAFFGPNGIGKSNLLQAVDIVSNPHQYEGRSMDSLFRKFTYNPDYDPAYQKLKEESGVASPVSPMEIEGVFVTDEGQKRVVITTNGVVVNELPKKNAGHAYYINADHPINMGKFQLDHKYDKEFLEIAKTAYNFNCSFGGNEEVNKLKDIFEQGKKSQGVNSEFGDEFHTDFVIEKYRTKVHFKRMSDGEKKIATLLRGLCDPTRIDNVDIILVDNIEMHIYFKRHLKMMQKLLSSFPDKQFIVTTHSSVLVDNLPKSFLYDIEIYKEAELVKAFGADWEIGHGY